MELIHSILGYMVCHLFALVTGLLRCRLLTSHRRDAYDVVSGVLSMAGSMLLMGVFSVVLHGVAQTVPNGSRVWLYRQVLCWSILLPYSIDALAILGLCSWVSFVPDIAMVFLLIGVV